jgi:hypothetical protein
MAILFISIFVLSRKEIVETLDEMAGGKKARHIHMPFIFPE